MEKKKVEIETERIGKTCPAYILLTKRNTPILIDGRLPIYHRRKVALDEAEKLGAAKVKKIWIDY